MTQDARARFWAGLGARRRTDLQATPDWEDRLVSALRAPHEAFGAEWLEPADFGGELGRSLEDDHHDTPSWWEHLRPADLYLARACARGVPEAIQRFEALYGDELARAAHRFERPGLAADDLLQVLRTKLFAAEGPDLTVPPRIASYTGQGFLQNWIRVTATRTFIDCARRQGDDVELPIANELIAVLPEMGADPELQVLKREHLVHFKAALAEAIGALESSDRLVLKQHLIERLTIDQVGALYHIHRATAARRVSKAREALLAATRLGLARRLGVAAESLDHVFELVASRLELSVERLLGQP